MQFFNQRYAAEVASRVSFNESIAGVLSGPAATAVLNLLVAIFYLLLLLQYNVTLTVIGLFFSSIDIIIFFALRRHLTDLNMKIQQDAGKGYGVTMNGLMMIETIKANGNEADFFAKWAGYKAKVLSASQDAAIWQMTATLVNACNNFADVNGRLERRINHDLGRILNNGWRNDCRYVHGVSKFNGQFPSSGQCATRFRFNVAIDGNANATP